VISQLQNEDIEDGELCCRGSSRHNHTHLGMHAEIFNRRYSRERGGPQAVYVFQKDRVGQISLAELLDSLRIS